MSELSSTIGLAALANDAALPRESTATAIAAAELTLRRKLAALFSEGRLPCDPALDILLEIYLGLRQARLRTPGDVAANTGLPTSSMTRWIKILEESGLVQRHKDTRDNRRICLTLTGAGHALAERAIETIATARQIPAHGQMQAAPLLQATPLPQPLFFAR